MIIVNGRQFNPEQMQVAGPWTDESKAIALRMAESAEYFAYSSMREFAFELYLRERIVQAARDLQAAPASFASFANDKCNPDYWERTDEGGFRLKSGKTSAEAIRDIYKHGGEYSFECATAIVIVYYKAVLESIGEPSFNELFAGLYLRDWHYDKDLGLRISYPPEIIPGDVKYFDNPDVDPKHMVWQGENTVYLGDDLFYGHGLGIRSAQDIIKHLNKHRKKDAERPTELLKQTTRPDFSYLAHFTGQPPSEPFAPAPGTNEGEAFQEREFITAKIGTKTYAVGNR